MVNLFDYASDEERLRVEERLHPSVTPEEIEKSKAAWRRINEDYRLQDIRIEAADRAFRDWQRRIKKYGPPPKIEKW